MQKAFFRNSAFCAEISCFVINLLPVYNVFKAYCYSFEMLSLLKKKERKTEFYFSMFTFIVFVK